MPLASAPYPRRWPYDDIDGSLFRKLVAALNFDWTVDSAYDRIPVL
jgi:hypothetical protein